jgi:ATP-dependent helicase HrpA
MVLEAQKHGCVREAMIITSALSIQDPRERPMDKQQASDEKHRRFHDKESDFLAFVNLWNYLGEQQKALSSNQFRRQCRVDFLNYLRVREWQDIYTQLRQVVKELGIPVNSEPAEYREIHIALLTGLLSHIGMKDAEKQEYTGARNARFSIFPVPACSRSRRNGPWSPSWWKPAACGDALPRVSIRNGWSRWRSIC